MVRKSEEYQKTDRHKRRSDGEEKRRHSKSYNFRSSDLRPVQRRRYTIKALCVPNKRLHTHRVRRQGDANVFVHFFAERHLENAHLTVKNDEDRCEREREAVE